MFELDQAVSEWRQQMATGGIRSSEVLDELESHLREDIRTILSGGTQEAQAFRLAVSRLGDADSVSVEFKKLTKSPATLKIAAVSTALAIGLVTVFGKPSLLLIAHIVTLTAGYCAAFVTGGFGIYHVCCRWFQASSPARQRALSHAVLSFSPLSVGLVVAGLLLGMLWSGRNLGRYFVGGPREIGAVCASVWLIAFWVVQRFGRVSYRLAMLLSIFGNMIISLAWFGTGIIAHGIGIASCWPLDAVLGVHLFFLAMGIVPILETAET